MPRQAAEHEGPQQGQLNPAHTEHGDQLAAELPNTVSTAAAWSSGQGPERLATMPKAKPDRPWTKPATTAPGDQ
jgi:hypothetical protein